MCDVAPDAFEKIIILDLMEHWHLVAAVHAIADHDASYQPHPDDVDYHQFRV